jgi:uncharacterized membrane protein
LALLVSAFVLWIFDRFAGLGPTAAVTVTVVLAFPAALGAATGRLVL